eukprot:gb/GECG01011983.1/.p1 GENE.gb/GECG01011983.1/~~gb/GECG01011983.1/.p1  ORF type:complete len:381 (+),score=58.70 gb/GECG01011983.1/:1-1143(+)
MGGEEDKQMNGSSDQRTDVPENANESCPGTKSEEAGKSSACAGCPNQNLCASGAGKKTDPSVDLVADRLKDVKNIILVLSGKGGVGKSTFASQLAFSLAADDQTQVGLLDVDICGPSIPRMLGLVGSQVHQSGTGWSPVWMNDNFGVMSIGFMLPNDDDAVIWRGPRKNGLIKQFLTDVEWEGLDYLVIDTPPGTSDEHISICQFLKKSNVAGAVVVTTPQEVAMSDVRKELSFCRKTGTDILGVVENMSSFECPKCSHESFIFPPAEGGGAGMAEKFSVPFLGRVPLDMRLTESCESGSSHILTYPESSAAKALRRIVKRLRSIVEKQDEESMDDEKGIESLDANRKEALVTRVQQLRQELKEAEHALEGTSTNGVVSA